MREHIVAEKEELKARLNEIAKQEEAEMIASNYPRFEKLIGTCYKVTNNYSLPKKKSDYWFLYTKITDIKPDDLYQSSGQVLCNFRGWQFQTDCNGAISINPTEHYIHSLGEQISEKEFMEAYAKMITKITSFIA